MYVITTFNTKETKTIPCNTCTLVYVGVFSTRTAAIHFSHTTHIHLVAYTSQGERPHLSMDIVECNNGIVDVLQTGQAIA